MSAPVNDPAQPFLLYEHATASGHVLAEARFNSERTLNALSLAMIEILAPALARWARDPQVAAVLFTGAGDRAFSAGGDIQALYHAMVKNHQAGREVDAYPFRFFEQEYRLDYAIHTFAKPVVAVGHGVVMGGGLGVFSGARYRVVCENSRIALPEVTIGLFPDAGATWLLRNLPGHLATFLGVTGANLNGGDAVACGMATHSVAMAERGRVADLLMAGEWTADVAQNHQVAAACLAELPGAALPAPQIGDLPESLATAANAQAVAEQVRALQGTSEWVDKAIVTMDRGCPTSVGLVVEQLTRAPVLDLADCFRLEMVVATHCARHPDFAEGVRALLIEKDNAPRWRYRSVADLPDAYVAEHFVAPWPANPLDDLEEETS